MGDVELRIVPANQAACGDLAAVFGERGVAADCQCQWFKLTRAEWKGVTPAERGERLKAQTRCGHAGPGPTTGLIAYLGEEPVGWCAVEPRTAYPRLQGARVPWTGREEDRLDGGVWAVTCFVTRAGFRKRGVSRALAHAAVGYARERGARAIEGYPIEVQPGKEYGWGELFVGTVGVFAAAGFRPVSRPTASRVVMRLELGA